MRAAYVVIDDESDASRLVIMDTGHVVGKTTVTNDVEAVVRDLAPKLSGRRLFYYDSVCDLDEIVVVDGKFAGFKVGPRERGGPLGEKTWTR